MIRVEKERRRGGERERKEELHRSGHRQNGEEDECISGPKRAWREKKMKEEESKRSL